MHRSSRSHSYSQRTYKQALVRNTLSRALPARSHLPLPPPFCFPCFLWDSGGCLSSECAHYQKQYLFLGMKGPMPLVLMSTVVTTEPFLKGMGVYQFRMHMASASQYPAGWMGTAAQRYQSLPGGPQATHRLLPLLTYHHQTVWPTCAAHWSSLHQNLEILRLPLVVID